jgi:methylmalonyl-CoA epimerase
VKGIHHVGLAVADVDEATATYERLFGAEVTGRDVQEEQGVRAVALRIGQSELELLEPLAADTPVGRFLARRGPGMHHVAYEVDDLAGALERLEDQGAQLIDTEPRPGLFGMQVAFVHPTSLHGVLSELVSVSTSTSPGKAGRRGTEDEHFG